MPRFERPLRLARNARRTPQCQRGAGDLAARGMVHHIRGEVIGGACAIVVAGGVDVLRRRVVHAIFGERVFAEGGKVLGLGPAGDGVVKIAHRVRLDQHLGQRVRLGQHQPVIGLHRQPDREVVPHRVRRHDIEHGEASDGLRMVQRHAVSDARPAVMAHHGEPVVPEALHQGNEVLCHGALGIGLVLGVIFGAGGIAITPQVRHHAGEALHQRGRNLVPHGMRLRKAMDQQQRRAGAADARENLDAGAGVPVFLRAWEERAHGARLHPPGPSAKFSDRPRGPVPARRCRGGRSLPASRCGRRRHRPAPAPRARWHRAP